MTEIAAREPSPSERPRIGLVLSGGGARGAYEAGVLAHLFEEVYPRLRSGFEFDVVSGTSVGAIHAAYVAASAHQAGAERASQLLETWRSMRVREVLQLSAGDLVGVPLRALGVSRLARRLREGAEVIGGLVDVRPLERIVRERVPWQQLPENLSGSRPGALCISCTEVRSGHATVFMDGPLADPAPWAFDANSKAQAVALAPRHVRASAAIPFFFPAVRLGERYYVDGGLRMNTPLSPALRLGCDRVLVVGLKHLLASNEEHPPYPEEVIGQPAFLLGKVLNALMLDRLEYELQRVELVNDLIEQGREIYGSEFLDRINVAVRGKRGADYRPVAALTLRPSRDVGRVAAECYRRQGSRSLGLLPGLLTRLALRGVPEDEADLLSYLFFDRCFTSALVEMGRADARARHQELLALLGG
ncbi:MAG: patatin-like phospholipase family protein [Myxococcota bacterium]